MTRNVLVVGHADSDGHLIAEQTRRNLALISDFNVRALVDPRRTQGHTLWTNLGRIPEIEWADLVFFVDLMFSPLGFVEEAAGLIDLATRSPSKEFYVIDHHPIPYRRLSEARNIRAIYRPSVFDCTFGPRSGMMVVAALCERQRAQVKPVAQAIHDKLALGMRRAAAPGGDLSGAPLMDILAKNAWSTIAALADEDRSSHHLVRGRRVANSPQSAVMVAAVAAFTDGAKGAVNHEAAEHTAGHSGRDEMPYDVDVERFSREQAEPHNLENAPMPAKDLETLMTFLEMAALSLTTSPEATFALEELVAEAQFIGGDGISVDLKDVENILGKASFIQKASGRLRLR